jgi:ATP-dependent Clp protease ATP-binding subunit ClpA
MWQRFTERARKVVFYAQEEAQKHGEGFVSPAHLLLGLLREPESVAGCLMDRLGIDAVKVRADVVAGLPKDKPGPTQDMTLTPAAKNVIDLAYDEARTINNNYIGTEHLLLGLIRCEKEGGPLTANGAALDKAREAVVQIQEEEGKRRESAKQADPVATAKPVPFSSYRSSAFMAFRHPNLSPDFFALILLAEKNTAVSDGLASLGVRAEDLVDAIELEMLSGRTADADLSLSEILAGGGNLPTLFAAVARHPATYTHAALTKLGVPEDQLGQFGLPS